VLARAPACRVSLLCSAGLATLAVRVPKHDVGQALLGALGRPLAAPSANLSGALSPTTAAHVAESLGDKVPLILDGGPCPVGLESTVLDLSGADPVLLRPGGVTAEALEPFVGRVRRADQATEIKSPGMLMSHYAPDRPLRSTGRPITLDGIACDFPELVLIGIHVGIPWVSEMIAMAWKHPNVFLGTSAYAPKYWKPEMVKFINSHGQDKVMWGTDFPLIDHAESLTQIDALGLRETSKAKLLHDNAARVFGLD